MCLSEEGGPCDPPGVLALEEEGLGLAILEAKDLAVASDVEFTLRMSDCAHQSPICCHTLAG